MEIFLFFKNGTKNINMEFFKYNLINTNLEKKIIQGIETYKNNTSNKYKKQAYNPLSMERGNKILETLSVKELLRYSKLFDLYHKIIKNDTFDKHLEDQIGDKHYTYDIKEIHGFFDNNLPLSFTVIVNDDIAYFKKTNEATYFLKNKSKIIASIEEANISEFKNNTVLIDTNFDFYVTKDKLFIKSSPNFERICKYEIVYELHREKILTKIEQEEIIDNFAEFKKECNKSLYLRGFKKIDDKFDSKSFFQNEQFLTKIISETNNKIKWNNDQTKIIVDTSQTKTIISLLSGLIGVDIYNDIVTFNSKEKIT